MTFKYSRLEREVTKVTKVCYIIGSVVVVVSIFVGLAVGSTYIFRFSVLGFIIIFLSIIIHFVLGEDTSVEMF